MEGIVKHFRLAVTFVFLALVTFATNALAQATPTDDATGRAAVLRDLGDPEFWLLMLIVAVFGAIGGVVYELLIFKGRLELPHRTDDLATDEVLDGAVAKYLYDLGILGRIFIGAAAAIVVIWLLDLEAEGAGALIGGAIVAGATGIAIFRSLQDRLLAAIATRDLAKTQAQAAAQTVLVDQAAAELEKIKAKLAQQGATILQESAQEGRRGIQPESAGVAESTLALNAMPELDNVSRLLGTARAMGVAAAGARTFAVPLRERVIDIVAAWARVEFSQVLPESRKLVEVWNLNRINTAPTDDALAILIQDLKRAFPSSRINLEVSDLRSGAGVDTVGKLADFIESRV